MQSRQKRFDYVEVGLTTGEKSVFGAVTKTGKNLFGRKKRKKKKKKK